jgi:hypothetical protein
VHIDHVSDDRSETPEQTLRRLQATQPVAASTQAAATSSSRTKVLSDRVVADDYEYPVPKIDPVAAYRQYTLGWRPDALVFMHPEMFPGREGQKRLRVEVAAFALVSAGLIRLSARRGLRRVFLPRQTIRPVGVLSHDDLDPPTSPMWASDAIMHKVYPPGRALDGSGPALYELTSLSRKAALASGVAHRAPAWWLFTKAVVDPALRATSERAARQLAQAWHEFSGGHPELRKALRKGTETPNQGG